jgi:hypothetical protein
MNNPAIGRIARAVQSPVILSLSKDLYEATVSRSVSAIPVSKLGTQRSFDKLRMTPSFGATAGCRSSC